MLNDDDRTRTYLSDIKSFIEKKIESFEKRLDHAEKLARRRNRNRQAIALLGIIVTALVAVFVKD